jgi:hypothetical protein
MRLIYQILFIIILGLILELFLPWWSVAIAACAGGLTLKSKYNFLAGFIAIALLWFVKAFIIDMMAATSLTEKVAQIFKLPNKAILYVVMMILGGLVGGFACMTGGAVRK